VNLSVAEGLFLDLHKGLSAPSTRRSQPWSPAEPRLCLVGFSWIREKGHSVPQRDPTVVSCPVGSEAFFEPGALAGL
jgi:hypothetical protein